MRFRPFGKLDWQVSALGLGCMRLPLREGGGSGNIDEEDAIRMIRHAVDRGVNYLDTAYPYHEGRSEVVVGNALAGGYRQKVRLATKSPIWLVHAADDFDRLLNEQLARLQTDHVEFYLLHGLSGERWRTVLELRLLERAEAALRDGRIGYLGFSFHDQYDRFQEIVDGFDGWTFCQIQYNYMDTAKQAGTRGLKYAASKGLAVVVMEPLLGGKLATPPDCVRELFAASGSGRTPVDWALRWVWDQPEVTTVLSGMSTMSQVEENLHSAGESQIGCLAPEDRALIDRVRAAYDARMAIPCTGCNYCMPCPNGVNIPGNFDLYNYGAAFGDVANARTRYTVWRFPNEIERAGSCIQCRVCEEKCPQGIAISEWMPEVHAVLGEGRSIHPAADSGEGGPRPAAPRSEYLG